MKPLNTNTLSHKEYKESQKQQRKKDRMLRDLKKQRKNFWKEI